MSEEREARNLAFRRLLGRLEIHNPARKGHGERVASYAVAIGYELGIRDEELYQLRWAAALHDVWKLEVSPEILERPSPLSEAELSAMRNAPLIFEAENGLPLLEDIVHLIGRQYDQGADTPLGSRIIFIATAFDVMTTDQPWRPARSERAALAEMRDTADPQVMEALIKVQPLIQPVKDV